MVKFLKSPMDGEIGPMRLLVDNSRLLRDLNKLISCGMEPESLFLKRYKVIKFLKLHMDGGIGPVRLLFPNSKSLSYVNNPISLGIDRIRWFVCMKVQSS